MGNSNLVAGLDIGSRSIELALLEGARLVDWAKVPTTFDPLAQCRRLLKDVQAKRLVTTGYGRRLVVENLPYPDMMAITEIQAYALGARHLCPQARAVLDIGGQDTKVIALSPQGKVVAFEMNDRCAAGTGKFLEFMALALQIPLEEFGGFALQASKRVQINSMCTVFAESEAIALMARGEASADIALGLHLAIVQRTLGMLKRVVEEPPLLFAGGVAHNRCVCALLQEALGQDIIVPPNPDLVGALGAAMYANSASVEQKKSHIGNECPAAGEPAKAETRSPRG